METINTNTSITIPLTFEDENGDPVTPTSASYTIYDTTSKTYTKTTTAINPTSSTYNLTIPGSDNTAVNEDNDSEIRIVTITWTYEGTDTNDHVSYKINILGNHYANPDNVKILYNGLDADVDSDLLEYGLNVSDEWVTQKIPGLDITNPPGVIRVAAELYTIGFILNRLYDTEETLSPLAEKYEKDADKLISTYASNMENSPTNPYSSSQTPHGDYLRYGDTDSYAYVRYKRRKVINNDPEAWTPED